MDDKNLLLLPATAYFNQQYQNQKVGSALKSIKNSADNRADPQLRAACMEMESLFINHLFKEMRATIDKSGFISGGRAEEIFTSMLDVEQSRNISSAGGIGLAAILLEQLGGKENSQTEPDS
jgi:flagellar protein FlgJ